MGSNEDYTIHFLFFLLLCVYLRERGGGYIYMLFCCGSPLVHYATAVVSVVATVVVMVVVVVDARAVLVSDVSAIGSLLDILRSEGSFDLGKKTSAYPVSISEMNHTHTLPSLYLCFCIIVLYSNILYLHRTAVFHICRFTTRVPSGALDDGWMIA